MNEKSMGVMFSSNTDLWATPIQTFQQLNKAFNFNLDVCASDDNAKCENYFTKEMDGLQQEWIGSCFMNPPYGKTIGDWIYKAYMESLKGSIVVCLIPARTDTKYFQDYCMLASDIYFVRGRLKFGDSNNSAPFPSCIVVFNKYTCTGTPRMHTLNSMTELPVINMPIVYFDLIQPVYFIS